MESGNISTNAILDENALSGLLNVYPKIPAPIDTTISGFMFEIDFF